MVKNTRFLKGQEEKKKNFSLLPNKTSKLALSGFYEWARIGGRGCKGQILFNGIF